MTPLLQRPLAGCRVGLSISESDDSANRGFPGWQVNRATVKVAAALFGQGAGVVFGHDWREDGVMEAVNGFAQQMQTPARSGAGSESSSEPLLYNLVPWPDEPRLSDDDRSLLADTLKVRQAGLPQELRHMASRALAEGSWTSTFQYLRARGLTYLRRQLDEASHARLCLGGKVVTYAGRYPGIVEEALIALENNKPLYVSGLLGGSAQHVIDAIEGKPMPPEFCALMERDSLYRQPPLEAAPGNEDAAIEERQELWGRLRSSGRAVAPANRLTAEECHELFHTPVLDRVVHLVLTGLSRFWHERRR